MSTTGNGQGGNGNGGQPIIEAVSADSEVGSAVSGKVAPPPGSAALSSCRAKVPWVRPSSYLRARALQSKALYMRACFLEVLGSRSATEQESRLKNKTSPQPTDRFDPDQPLPELKDLVLTREGNLVTAQDR